MNPAYHKPDNKMNTHAVHVFNARGDILVLNKEIMTARHILHDMPFDFLVFKHSQPVVDEDWRRCSFKVGSEIGRRFQHVDRRHFQAYGL